METTIKYVRKSVLSSKKVVLLMAKKTKRSRRKKSVKRVEKIAKKSIFTYRRYKLIN